MESVPLNQSLMLAPNSLAFIALCNEYCQAIEHARESTRDEFVATMLRQITRIYISASDLKPEEDMLGDEAYIDNVLDEQYYDSLRRHIENLLGEDDSYLEVFEEDMKYSDTPIAASISEDLCDIFQVMYNLLDVVRDAPDELVQASLVAAKEDFETYWSRPLCNVFRALNNLRYFA